MHCRRTPLSLRGTFYDSECPAGVRDCKELPIFGGKTISATTRPLVFRDLRHLRRPPIPIDPAKAKDSN